MNADICMQVMELEKKIKALPNRPGIYQFKDESGEVIYVGKAKKLRNRVTSYFNKDKAKNGKTRLLVRRIADLSIIEVESEQDALLLENNLIKELKPRYNILLKDDKTFPWLCVTNEPFPRIFPTRTKKKDGSKYYGPYASVKLMKNLLALASKLYPLRSCRLDLNEDNITAGKFKVCLEYHIGNCLGPCVGHQSREDYEHGIEMIKRIIRGNTREVIDLLNTQMAAQAAELDFEKAAATKERLELVERYQSKSKVATAAVSDAEVYTLRQESGRCYVNFMKVVEGGVVQGHTLEIRTKLEEVEEDLLAYAITEIREQTESASKEIITAVRPSIDLPGVDFTIPQRGERKGLIELGERNLKYHVLEKRKQQRMVDPDAHYDRILTQMKKDLRMTELPRHIECFDNSNIQGTNAVAACVVFKNGKASKKDYRHFNIRTVVGPDDFASMEEVVRRRYKRLVAEKEPLPQLVIIDGGKGQLSSAMKSIEELGLRGQITVIGIAKKLEEIYFPGDSIPIYIDKRSESLKLIQNLRNEAHRFGITHHRNKRSKAALGSELTTISGIGEGTAEKLLRKFGSVKNIKEANEEQLALVVGMAKAKVIFRHFH